MFGAQMARLIRAARKLRKSRQADAGARVWQVQGEVVVCKQSIRVPALSEDSR